MSDCKITSLPELPIAIILSYNDITMEDIINFRCVCKQFRYAAATYNKFLEKKLFQRWPYAKKEYERLKKTEDGKNINIDFLTTGKNCATEFRNYLSQILFFDYYYNSRSNQNYFDKSIDNVLKFDDVLKFSGNINEYINRLNNNLIFCEPINMLKYTFYIEEIYSLTQSPRIIDRNSIERYCNIERARYEKLSSIRNELDRYMENETKQLLEESCTFVAKYIQVQKNVCNIQCTYTNVSASLDTIAQEVRNCLRKKHPNHSIFSTSEETVSSWKTKNIEDNHWDETESTQIMDTLQEYIFGTLEFRACNCSPVDIKYLCIDYVLQNKYGKDIIVYTIFHSVARRLGIRCDVREVVYYFCIFWKPKFVMNDSKNARCFYIKKDNFPNCLRDFLPTYMLYKSLSLPSVARITPRELLVFTRLFVKDILTQHDITQLNLVQLNCAIVLT